jgi:hypothetical protein
MRVGLGEQGIGLRFKSLNRVCASSEAEGWIL